MRDELDGRESDRWQPTRRRLLALSASAGLAGCSWLDDTDRPADRTTQSSTAMDQDTQTEADGHGQYFDDTGALSAPVDNRSVRTDRVSRNVAAGAQLLAYDDDGTATVVDGETRSVLYTDTDIGVLFDRIQTDFPDGVHLHLTDLFEYSENIVITTPMRLTGELVGTPIQRDKGIANGPRPTGLRFTGSGKAFRLYNGESAIRNVSVEDLYIHAKSGTVAFELWDPTEGTQNPTDGYSPYYHGNFRNITTQGGSEAGIVIHGTFVSNFETIRSYDSGGVGIRIDGAGISRFGQLQSKFSSGTGIEILQTGSSTFDNIYTNYAGGDGIHIRDNVDNSFFATVFAESNAGTGVRVDLTRSEIRRLRARDNDEYGIVVEELSRSNLGMVHASHGDVRIEYLYGASEIDTIETDRGGIDAEDAVLKSNSMIHTVNNDNAGPSAFNAATLTADNGRLLWNFDTLFRNPPMLAYGRRGGGIERVRFREDDSGWIFGVELQVADPQGTVDVRVLPNGSVGEP